MTGDIHHNARPHALSGQGSACRAGDQPDAVLSREGYELLQVGRVFGESHRQGRHSVNRCIGGIKALMQAVPMQGTREAPGQVGEVIFIQFRTIFDAKLSF